VVRVARPEKESILLQTRGRRHAATATSASTMIGLPRTRGHCRTVAGSAMELPAPERLNPDVKDRPFFCRTPIGPVHDAKYSPHCTSAFPKSPRVTAARPQQNVLPVCEPLPWRRPGTATKCGPYATCPSKPSPEGFFFPSSSFYSGRGADPFFFLPPPGTRLIPAVIRMAATRTAVPSVSICVPRLNLSVTSPRLRSVLGHAGRAPVSFRLRLGYAAHPPLLLFDKRPLR